MSGAMLPLPQYAFMAWYSVKKAQEKLYLYLTNAYVEQYCQHELFKQQKEETTKKNKQNRPVSM
jgi:hypothetical protein